MKNNLLLFGLLVSLTCSGQNPIKTAQIQGAWEFKTSSSDTEECLAPDPFPLKEFHFLDSRFKMISFNDTVMGDFEIIDKKLRMFNSVKNGTPQSKDQELIIKSIDKGILILELPFECGLLYLSYQKKE